MTSADDPRAHLFEVLSRAALPYLVRAALSFDLPDILGDRTLSVDTVAQSTELDARQLIRLTRALCDIGLLERADAGGIRLSGTGQLLRSDRDGSLAGWARLVTHPTALQPWDGLEHSLRTGRAAFEKVFGAPAFEFIAADPERNALYNTAMGATTRVIAEALADRYPLDWCRTVADIGGGDGTLLATVLDRWPGLDGTVFDTATGNAAAAATIRNHGLEDSCSIVDGDFFVAVPAGHDLYVLKWILHDWDDPEAVAILRTCRAAMSPASRMLVVEKILPEPAVSGPVDPLLSDLTLLVLYGGRNRTASELRQLCAAADLEVARVLALPAALGVSAVEILPVGQAANT